LCALLLYLKAPDAIAKTIALMDKATVQEEQIYYIMRLRNITNGWTLAERQDYLHRFLKNGWMPPEGQDGYPGFLNKRPDTVHDPVLLGYFKTVDEPYYDGVSFDQFLNNFHDEFAATLTPQERKDLAEYLPSKKSPIAAARGNAICQSLEHGRSRATFIKTNRAPEFWRGPAVFFRGAMRELPSSRRRRRQFRPRTDQRRQPDVGP
jgi:hypothetical protein